MHQQTHTIGQLLSKAESEFLSNCIESPRQEALFLLSGLMGRSPMDLYMISSETAEPTLEESLDVAVARRINGEPSQYILGEQEFYGRTFKVGPSVLIPRPETELLVEEAISIYSKLDREVRGRGVLDLCTGSGCIAITLALELSGVKIVATDSSEAAIAIAIENAKALQVIDSIVFLGGDLFDAIKNLDIQDKYGIILSNPPYVSGVEIDSLDPLVLFHEPRGALYGGEDGLDFYRRIAEEAPAHLVPGGRLVLEIGMEQSRGVSEILTSKGHFRVDKIISDLSGMERIVTATLVATTQDDS